MGPIGAQDRPEPLDPWGFPGGGFGDFLTSLGPRIAEKEKITARKANHSYVDTIREKAFVHRCGFLLDKRNCLCKPCD